MGTSNRRPINHRAAYSGRDGGSPAPRPSDGGPVRPWNANIHYDALLARTMSVDARRVLDVGTGDGFLVARLARRGVPEVVGLDADAGVLRRAAERWGDLDVTWQCGDVLTHPFEAGSFDAIVSNATLHHLPDTAVALGRLRDLLAPGGTLAVVGFARNGPFDWPGALAGGALLVALNAVRRKWEHSAPQHWPPPLTYAQTRRTPASVLPGSRFRKLVFGRFALTWTKSRDPSGPS